MTVQAIAGPSRATVLRRDNRAHTMLRREDEFEFLFLRNW
jgi:hypothetical protein